MMHDRSIIDISPSTLFKIDEYQPNNGDNRAVELGMEYGKIRTSVTKPVGPKGRFNVRTRSATMGVRGTEFVIQAENTDGRRVAQTPEGSGQTQITVLHGKVEVAGSSPGMIKPVALTAGAQLTTSQNAEPPKVVSLSPSEMTAIKSEAKQQDNTFMAAVSIDSGTEGGKSGGPGGGTATLAAVAASFSEAQAGFKEAPPIGIPGALGPGFVIKPDTNVPIGAPVNVKVIFSTN